MSFVKEAYRRTNEVAKSWVKSGRSFGYPASDKYAKERIKDTERFIKGRR